MSRINFFFAVLAGGVLPVAPCWGQDLDLKEYFPEPVEGTRILYRVELVAPGTGFLNGQAVVLTEGEVTIDTTKYWKTSLNYRDLPMMPEIRYWRTTPDGIYETFPDARDQPEALVQPFPVEIGRRWQYRAPHARFDCEVGGFANAAFPERVIDDALKITCKGLQREAEWVRSEEYLARGIGPVRQIVKYKPSGRRVVVGIDIVLLERTP